MDIAVENTVTDVTVYPDRARVTSRGQADLTEGIHQLVIGDLPLALEPESVRATGSGAARVRLRSVDVQRRHYVQAPAANVIALEARIETLQGQVQALDDQMAVRQSSIGHLDGLRKATTEYAWGLARGRHTVEKQAELLHFFEEEETRLRGELRGLEDEKQALKDELVKLQAELEQIRAARPRQRYEARLEVEVLSPGAFTAEVNYVVNRAGWRPLYDIRLQDATTGEATTVAVTTLAEITQNTGQDWAGVRLSVSTARPALNQRVPELRPWFIDVVHPQPRMMKAHMAEPARMKNEMQVSEMADESPLMAMAAPAVVEAETVVAEAQESGAAVSFAVSGSVDIPGDGTPKKTALGNFTLEPHLDFLSAPRHTDAVYRRAKLVNSTGAPLLAGPVNLYDGEEYIGQNRLTYTPGGGEVELILGVEERIKVKRELVRREVDKRLLRDQRQVAYGYEIKLENLMPTAARITVQDQYPVSRHDQIKVRLDRATPEPVENSDLHILKWELKLEPQEKRTIQYEYQVEHPRALPVMGLAD